jgi:hypothetical protein
MREEGLYPSHFLVVEECIDYKDARFMRQRDGIAWRQIVSVMEVGCDDDDDEEEEGVMRKTRENALFAGFHTERNAVHRVAIMFARS